MVGKYFSLAQSYIPSHTYSHKATPLNRVIPYEIMGAKYVQTTMACHTHF